jgi:hypothetical protein
MTHLETLRAVSNETFLASGADAVRLTKSFIEDHVRHNKRYNKTTRRRVVVMEPLTGASFEFRE